MGVLGFVPVALRAVVAAVDVVRCGNSAARLAAAVTSRMRAADRVLRCTGHRRQVLARPPTTPSAAPTPVAVVRASLLRGETAALRRRDGSQGTRSHGTSRGTVTLPLRHSRD